jgi:hypothetical protein
MAVAIAPTSSAQRLRKMNYRQPAATALSIHL